MDRFLKRPRSAAPASGAPIDASGGSGSRFCACPVCGKNVPFATINQHLDSPQCTAAEGPATAATVPRALPGVARMSAAPEPASQSSATPGPAASCAKDSLSMLMQGARFEERAVGPPQVSLVQGSDERDAEARVREACRLEPTFAVARNSLGVIVQVGGCFLPRLRRG